MPGVHHQKLKEDKSEGNLTKYHSHEMLWNIPNDSENRNEIKRVFEFPKR